MTLNRGNYPTVQTYNSHLAALERLAQAIRFEEEGLAWKARIHLAMACQLELKAFGFESTTADIVKTIKPWGRKPTSVPTVH